VSVHLPQVDSKTYREFNACVHCGLCLQACPTYVETKDEADSPRGRILLMRAMVDGRMEPSDIAFEHLDRCLVCRACEPACPSGVNYHTLIESVRPQVAEAVLGKGRQQRSRSLQWLIGKILPHAKRASAAMFPLKVARRIGLGGLARALSPKPLRHAMDMVPDVQPPAPQAPFIPAVGGKRGTVVLLRGCVGSVVSQNVNAACIKVLTRNGFDVRQFTGSVEEPCCGALAEHANDRESAHAFAMHMVDLLDAQSADYFVSPIAGCGAQLKALDKMVAHLPGYADKAARVVKKMRDISELLTQVGIATPTKPLNRRVTYHDPCHLAHAQRITDPPRKLLAMIPGLTVLPLPESDMCCGAAGTYNLNQPEMAARLGQRKADHILATGAQELITANIGCSMQIARHLKEASRDIPVRHVIEILAEAMD
jgi:glycolate oxidase iron-sulfur subunit